MTVIHLGFQSQNKKLLGISLVDTLVSNFTLVFWQNKFGSPVRVWCKQRSGDNTTCAEKMHYDFVFDIVLK